MTDREQDATGIEGNGKLARAVVAELNPAQREVLGDYMASLILLKQQDLPAQTKVLDSIDLTADKQVLGVLTKGSGRLLAKHAWKDRSWKGRIGLSAAALVTLFTAGQGAAVAVLGSAVGVPLWIVFGSGDSFAGELLEEVARMRGETLDTDHQIPRETAAADPDLSLDVEDIVEELEDEFSGEAERKRIDEALGLDPEIFDTVKERLDELKEEIRSGRNPGDLLQSWLRKRKE
jgi:hypothetical protein